MVKNKIIPRFSIITVVLNNEKFLNDTIKSIISQSYKNFEYIIIDGKSKDNTLDIIKKYKNKITKFISEKDRGIYDAFNKGIRLASGEYICIVNSDDKLKINALKIINKYINKYPEIDFFFGSVKKHWGVLHGYQPKKIKYSWGFYSSHSTGFYIKNESAKKVGPYNIKYKYHSDYDYFYRMIVKKKMKGIATKKNEVVGIFRRGGYSSSIPYRKLFVEELKIRHDNGQSIILILILGIYKILNYWKKKMIK
jgi:glycosyltransferase involved in cell wall biosynthesis